MKHFISILFLFTACCAFAQNDIVVLGVADFTNPSTGEFGSGPLVEQIGSFTERQTSRGAAGLSVEYRHWWGKNGGTLTYAITPTDSKLVSSQTGRFQWGLTRNEFALGWAREFHSQSKVSGFVETGVGEFLLNGASGFDHQFEVIIQSGSEARLSSNVSLRLGCALHLFRASNFSDDTYLGGRTFMIQPQIGIVWTFRRSMKHGG